MLETLEAFRTQVGGRPLLLLAAVVAVSLASRGPRPSSPASGGNVVGFITIAGLIGLLAYPAAVLWYAWDPHFFDNAEPTMPAVAWMFHAGRPVYPAVEAAERYAHIYGPVGFIVQALALTWLGPSILVSKLTGAAGGLGALGFLCAAMRRHTTGRRAAVLTGVCALVLLMFRHASFWNRPDSLQLLVVGGALYAAGFRRWPWAVLMVGLASGALWNLKFTGPLYSLPVLALVYRRFGRVPLAMTAAIAAATAVLPFAVLPNVSFDHYIAWVRLSGQTGLLLSTLRQNIEWAAFLTLPLLLVRFVSPPPSDEADSSDFLPLVALLVAICGVMIAAAKPGAGPYHLMPFALVAIYLVAQRLGRGTLTIHDGAARRAAAGFAGVALVIATAQQAQLAAAMSARRGTHEMEDIAHFLASHGGVVEMGYGRTEALSHARPVLVFRNNSYLIDQPAIREQQLQGQALPAATVDAVAACDVRYWLVPKGEPPFTGVNGYAAVLLQPLYPEVLRRRFAETHVHRESTEYYDVWECGGRK